MGLAMAPLRCHAVDVEKRRPRHSLAGIKAEFSEVAALRITRTALTCASALDISLEDVVAVIQSLTAKDFYKSMTSQVASSIWQDVYHATWRGTALYVKFTTDREGYLVISFKEK
jgi:motility quorum-sensing regulator/GCU-specific mRNA interferase toxin